MLCLCWRIHRPDRQGRGQQEELHFKVNCERDLKWNFLDWSVTPHRLNNEFKKKKSLQYVNSSLLVCLLSTPYFCLQFLYFSAFSFLYVLRLLHWSQFCRVVFWLEETLFVNHNQCWEDVTVLRNLKGSREVLRLMFLFWLKAIGKGCNTMVV